MGRHVLGHAALEEPGQSAEAARPDDHGVEATVTSDPLDRSGRVADRLEQLRLDALEGEERSRFLELLVVDGIVVPGVDRGDGRDGTGRR